MRIGTVRKGWKLTAQAHLTVSGPHWDTVREPRHDGTRFVKLPRLDPEPLTMYVTIAGVPKPRGAGVEVGRR